MFYLLVAMMSFSPPTMPSILEYNVDVSHRRVTIDRPIEDSTVRVQVYQILTSLNICDPPADLEDVCVRPRGDLPYCPVFQIMFDSFNFSTRRFTRVCINIKYV